MKYELQSEGLVRIGSSGREWSPRSVDPVFLYTVFPSLVVDVEGAENNPYPQSDQGCSSKGLANSLMFLCQICLRKPSKDAKDGLWDDDSFQITSCE